MNAPGKDPGQGWHAGTGDVQGSVTPRGGELPGIIRKMASLHGTLARPPDTKPKIWLYPLFPSDLICLGKLRFTWARPLLVEWYMGRC